MKTYLYKIGRATVGKIVHIQKDKWTLILPYSTEVSAYTNLRDAKRELFGRFPLEVQGSICTVVTK